MHDNMKFKVLFTHQKLKKRKTWQDGYLSLLANTKKATLLNEENKTIDSLFVKESQLQEDSELESEKYLIQIENLIISSINSGKTNKENADQIVPNSNQNEQQERKSFTSVQLSKSKNKLFRPVFAKHGSKPVIPVTPVVEDGDNKQITYGYDSIQSANQNRRIVSSSNQQSDSEFLSNHHSKHSVEKPSIQKVSYKSIDHSSFSMRNHNSTKNNSTTSKLNFSNKGNQNFDKSTQQRTNLPPSNTFRNLPPSNNCHGSRVNKRSSDDILSLFATQRQDDSHNDDNSITDLESHTQDSLDLIIKKHKEVVPSINEKVNQNGSPDDYIFNDVSKIKSKQNSSSDDYIFNDVSTNLSKHNGSSDDFMFDNIQDFEFQQEFEPPCKKAASKWDFFQEQSTSSKTTEENIIDMSNVNYNGVSGTCSNDFLDDIREIPGEIHHGIMTSPKNVSSKSISRFRVIEKSSNVFQPPKSSFVAPSSNRNGSYCFPSMEECVNKQTPRRSVKIPLSFDSAISYKQTFSHALKEHMNIILFNIAVKYHEMLSKVDLTFFNGNTENMNLNSTADDSTPKCKHGISSKLKTVRKDGANKGKMFYSCSMNNDKSCNYFVWFNEVNSRKSSKSETNVEGTKNIPKKVKFTDPKSVNAYFNSQQVELYCCCKILYKTPFQKYQKGKKKYGGNQSKRLYIQLPFKKSSSYYAKSDIWIISKTLDFKKSFTAKSVFYGPNQSCELEIDPLCLYSTSNWSNNDVCYAIQAFNGSTELTCLDNLETYVNKIDLPIMHNLLTNSRRPGPQNIYQKFDINCLEHGELAEFIENATMVYELNEYQNTALQTIARMFQKQSTGSVTLIHGVFGAGKSYLLSTVVLFLVQLFEFIESKHKTAKLKLLIASTTNVAVDRVLLGLLDLGFDEFIRVGSIKKIAKPILPHSVHSSDQEDHELKELNELIRTELSETEKGFVRKAIEHHKLGINRKKLTEVRVVGVTCMSCLFPYLQGLTFNVQLLDECSQMMEPLSLLPIARFKCEKLVLVGDPKQLAPTIQGSEAEHSENLELTMFERLHQMGIEPVILRTQYRCHPKISSVCNQLFYDGVLVDGVTSQSRIPLIESLPTLSFIHIKNGSEKSESDGSYSNLKESEFIVNVLGNILKHDDINLGQVGVITQYRSQVKSISSLFGEKISLASDQLKSLQISTVDAFQGGEKEIILLSCVRSRHIGFIDCPRRTNVALSRAKRHLIIAGNYNLLKNNKVWGGVIEICKEMKGFFTNSEDFNRILGL